MLLTPLVIMMGCGGVGGLLNLTVDVTIFELCTPKLQLIMGLVKGLNEPQRRLAVLQMSRRAYLHPV